MHELMRFIVRPRVEVAEEAQETDANDGDVDKPPPDYVRRAFRSLKMLVDDPRVSQMLFDNLSDLAPVAFEIFENLTPETWSMEDREVPSLFHWSALVHTMLNARTTEMIQTFVDCNLLERLLPWMSASPVYETFVMVASKALSQPEAASVLMESLTQSEALPQTVLNHLSNPALSSSALTFLALLVERANKMRLSCVLFEHVFTAGVVEHLVQAAVGPAGTSKLLPRSRLGIRSADPIMLVQTTHSRKASRRRL